MSDQSNDRTGPQGLDLGRLQPPPAERRIAPADLIAGAVTLVWLALVGLFFLFSGGTDAAGRFSTLMVLLAIVLPVALIWMAAATARATSTLRTETQRLQATLDILRTTLVQQSMAPRPSVEKRLEEIAQAARMAETALATFTSRRDAEATEPSADRKAALVPARPARPDEEQPALALGTPGEENPAPVSVQDFVRALNFPESQDDREGIRALRRALEDRNLAKLIRAAQDILTLLGQDGIYMDDIKADRAKPDLWRRFAQGERGKTIAALGGVRDRSSLALTAGRMRQDTVFRDTAHHFLRQFDKTIADFEKNASDQELIALSDTRTARAFMLLGRVTGTFD
ncbi:hypothetical protein OU426_12670 [Frigidibacter sp. RF13]|uniref:hypothetical protein n=1 Tax=Frigidibacter sp. RF13 TaxID=2997340 RepID=UPI00226DC209|nr:hypothetical protein [Frigidibacter sp. RF13]MCY1127709.1 hypothetical protein [Frigidibacter sp. RF13]